MHAVGPLVCRQPAKVRCVAVRSVSESGLVERFGRRNGQCSGFVKVITA